MPRAPGFTETHDGSPDQRRAESICMDGGLVVEKIHVARLGVRRSIPGKKYPRLGVEYLMQRSMQPGFFRYHPKNKETMCQTISIPVMCFTSCYQPCCPL